MAELEVRYEVAADDVAIPIPVDSRTETPRRTRGICARICAWFIGVLRACFCCRSSQEDVKDAPDEGERNRLIQDHLDLNNLLKQKTKQVEALEDQIKPLQNSKKELEATLEKCQQAKETELQQKTKQIAALESEIDRLKNDTESKLQREIEKSKTSEDKMNEMMSTNRNLVDTHKREQEELMRKLNDAEQEHSRKLQENGAKMKALKTSMNELNRQLKEAHESNERLKNELSKFGLGPPIGLVNLGNTCYFNAVMQVINRTFQLEDELVTQKDFNINDLSAPLTSSLLELYRCKLPRANSSRGIDPSHIFSNVCARSSRFCGGRQQDSHELLRHLMDGVKEEEKELNKYKSDSGPYRGLTTVDRVFGGHYLTVFSCSKCQAPYHLFEPFLDMSLPIAFRNEDDGTDTGTERKELGQPMKNEEDENMGDGTTENGEHERTRNEAAENGKQETNQEKASTDGIHNAGTELTEYHEAPEDGGHRKMEDETPENGQCNAVQTSSQQSSDDSKMNYKTSIEMLLKRLGEPKAATRVNTVLDSLRFYTRLEQLDEYLCLECNKGRDDYTLSSGSKQTIVFNPPAILTVHLKRFEQTATGYSKVSCHIGFDTELELAPYCSFYAKRRQEKPSVKYSLYGVVVHNGSLQSGHYTACLRMRSADVGSVRQFLQTEFLDREDHMKPDKLIELIKAQPGLLEVPIAESKWHYVSDTSVSEISEKDVLQMEAYLLFYARVY